MLMPFAFFIQTWTLSRCDSKFDCEFGDDERYCIALTDDKLIPESTAGIPQVSPEVILE